MVRPSLALRCGSAPHELPFQSASVAPAARTLDAQTLRRAPQTGHSAKRRSSRNGRPGGHSWNVTAQLGLWPPQLPKMAPTSKRRTQRPSGRGNQEASPRKKRCETGMLLWPILLRRADAKPNLRKMIRPPRAVHPNENAAARPAHPCPTEHDPPPLHQPKALLALKTTADPRP